MTATATETVQKMSYEEWQALGEKLYGKDKKQWKFKCVQCGHVQTAQDFIDRKIDPNGVVHFSCLGRWDNTRGCDWTLGGLFRIHKREVTPPDGGDPVPVFLFADEVTNEGSESKK